jgi:hypothetical protein
MRSARGWRAAGVSATPEAGKVGNRLIGSISLARIAFVGRDQWLVGYRVGGGPVGGSKTARAFNHERSVPRELGVGLFFKVPLTVASNEGAGNADENSGSASAFFAKRGHELAR